MKNSRLSGLIAFIVAILLVGGLVYFELTRNQAQETVASAPAASSETAAPAPTGGEAAVQPAAPANGQAAPAAGDTSAAAPTAPAASDTSTAAAPANPPATAAETPAPAASAPAATAANPPPTATDSQTAAAPASQTPAANAAPGTPPADQTANANAAAGTPPADQTANAAPAAAPAPAATTAPAGGEQVASAEPPPTAATPGKPAAPAMAKSAPIVPSFDVVRVEPTGETVVAGQAAPGAKVDVLDGAAVVASATANDRGEWALALDNALKPGTHDLAIRMTSKDGAVSTLSDERVAVEVPKPGSKDVLVVVNTPDKPSRVLELPGGKVPAASGGEQVASAAGTAPAGEAPAAATGSAPAKPGEVAALAPKSPAAQSPDLVKSPPGEPGTAGSAPTATAPSEPATNAAAGNAPAAPATAETAPAPAEPAKPAPPKPDVAVSAVEADTAGTLYVAGTAATDQTVRVYLNDKPLGEAKPSPSGTWLVEVHHEVPPGSYQVRADQVSGPDGKVIARAEVPFERKIEVASLKASGDTGTAAASPADASGKLPQVQTVIIKKGDNLWTIARDTWGRGITWSTLYQANKDQIRNPHWIYPGQVFIMPASPEVAKQ